MVAMALLEFVPAAACRSHHFFSNGSDPCHTAVPSWGRPFSLTPTYQFLGSNQSHRALASSAEDNLRTLVQPLPCKRKIVEERWLQFFSDPSQWWDHRSEKLSAGYPDFKHKKRMEALWLKDKLKPPWVEAELAAMEPGILQLSTFSWNIKLANLVKAQQYAKALELFHQMQQDGNRPDNFTFTRVLKACARLGLLEEGRLIHAQIRQCGFESDLFVSSCLIDMYAKCGSIDDARALFDKMPTRNIVSWNAMILGYVRCEQGKKALKLFRKMKREGLESNRVTFLALLSACASCAALEEGRGVHTQIIESGYLSDVFVGTSLVDMYAKCGSINDAWRVFTAMSTHDVVSCNTMLMGFKNCGQAKKALEIYQEMQLQGIQPDFITYIGVLNACTSEGALEEGRKVHMQLTEKGFESNVFINNSLVDMYSKCGSIEDALKLFYNMPTRDVVSWNTMIMGYVKCGLGQSALELFREMQQEGVEPDCITFVGMLNACAKVGALSEGTRVHTQIIASGCESDVFVGSSLIHMYSKCGRSEDAWRVFNEMPEHNVVSWNAMIMGFVKCGQWQKALELSRSMLWDGVEPDHITLLGVLNACTSAVAHAGGRGIEDACRVFDKIPIRSVISWNVLILGHLKCGQGLKALDLSRKMQQEGVEPNRDTFVSLLDACASIGALQEGSRVHAQIIKSGCECDALVGSSLINMYAKCGSMEDAWRVFHKMPTHDVASWKAVIQGHLNSGQMQTALDLLQQMQEEWVEPAPISLVDLLNPCQSVPGLEYGKDGRIQISGRGWESDVPVRRGLVPNVRESRRHLQSIQQDTGMEDDFVDPMLAVYARHGHVKDFRGHINACVRKV